MRLMKTIIEDKLIKWWIDKDGRIIDKKKWAIQDKDGNWWLISDSESPKKKKKKNKMNCGTPPTFNFKKYLYRIIFAAILGVSIGVNIFFIFIHTIR